MDNSSTEREISLKTWTAGIRYSWRKMGGGSTRHSWMGTGGLWCMFLRDWQGMSQSSHQRYHYYCLTRQSKSLDIADHCTVHNTPHTTDNKSRVLHLTEVNTSKAFAFTRQFLEPKLAQSRSVHVLSALQKSTVFHSLQDCTKLSRCQWWVTHGEFHRVGTETRKRHLRHHWIRQVWSPGRDHPRSSPGWRPTCPLYPVCCDRSCRLFCLQENKFHTYVWLQSPLEALLNWKKNRIPFNMVHARFQLLYAATSKVNHLP